MTRPRLDLIANPRPRGLGLLAIGVGLAALLVFLPSLGASFLAWDDDHNFLDNQDYRGLTPRHLYWMLTTFHLGPYQPLSWLTLGLDYVLWGMNPFGYHLTTVLLHALGAGLFTLMAARLWLLHPSTPAVSSDGSPRTAFPELRPDALLFAASAGLFWALHPLRVEAVAWITERREVLCGCLTLLALHAHLSGRRGGTWLLVLAALLAKGTAVALPFLFILIDLYRSNAVVVVPGRPALARAIGRAAARHAVSLLLAAVFAGVALYGQRSARALIPLTALGPAERLLRCGHGLFFYPWMTLWPARLAPVYEAPADASSLLPTAAIGGLAGLAAVLLALRAARRRPAIPLLLAAFLGMLLPFSGLIQTGPHVVANRYAYQPGWVLSLVPAATLVALVRRFIRGGGAVAAAGNPGQAAAWPPRAWIPTSVFAAVVSALIFVTVRQQRAWRDTDSLWHFQLARDPDTALAHYNLALRLVEVPGRADGRTEAEQHLRAALAKFPGFAVCHGALGDLLARSGRLGEAIDHYHAALRVAPDDLPSLAGLAEALWRVDRRDEALRTLQDLVSRDPGSFRSHLMRARARAAAGRAAEALA